MKNFKKVITLYVETPHRGFSSFLKSKTIRQRVVLVGATSSDEERQQEVLQKPSESSPKETEGIQNNASFGDVALRALNNLGSALLRSFPILSSGASASSFAQNPLVGLRSSAKASQVVLDLRQPDLTDSISYGGIVKKNKLIKLDSKTLLVVTLKYSVDLQSQISCGKQPFNHSIKFHLVPLGSLTCNVLDILDAVRSQVYSPLRDLQHAGVAYISCTLEIYSLTESFVAGQPLSTKNIENSPGISVLVGFTGKGKQDLPILQPTAEDLRALSMVLDFRLELAVNAAQSEKDTNRFSIMGHSYLRPADLFASDPFLVGGNVVLVEGSPRLEFLKFGALLVNGLIVANIPFLFLDYFRGREYLCEIANAQVTGLRATSKTSRKGSDPSLP